MVPEPLKKARELPQIPGYRIEGIVGRGATGIVYRARQASVDRVVALKVLHSELVGSASALRRMQREARLTAKLAHPNIISAIDMGEVGGQLWYAMELIDGLSLLERIAERPLSEREALRVFIPLCEALRHAHERGVVHRDIKPANILIERGGRALLVDLGLAYSEDDPVLTKSGGTLGTPHYISPEQARDPASADVQSDLWSFGATLYHAVTGRTPFQGDSVAEILSNVLYARVPDPREVAPEISSGMVLVLRKCLTRDRANRYGTPAELLADLERLRERRAPQIQKGGLDPLARRPLSGPRLWATLAGGVLLCGAAGWFGWQEYLRRANATAPEAPRDPFEALNQACEGPARGLAAALTEAERLGANEDLAPRARERLEALHNRLLQRLDGEIGTLQHDLDAQVDTLLGTREFAKAFALADGSPRLELERRTGSRALPPKQSDVLDDWQKGLRQRVLERRDEAVDSFTLQLDEYGSQVLRRADQLEHDGDWKQAHDLLSRTKEQLLADSHVDASGLEPRVVELRTTRLRERTDGRRKSLDESWARTDQELVTWIDRQSDELAQRLEERRAAGASQALQAEFADELARRGLSSERLPVHLPRRSPEELVAKGRELDALEARYGEQDSGRLFDELELQAQPLWRARRYEEVEQLFAGRPEGLLRGDAAQRAGLRAREANMLGAVLASAAKRLAGSTGQRLELSVGTVPIQGVLEAPADPLAQGFKLKPDGAVPRSLVLRTPRSGEQQLAAESLAKLAGLAPEQAQRDPRERLLRALFLYHEAEPGDLAALDAVSALLDGGAMPADDALLVKDLGLRVAEAHDRTLDLASRKLRDKARERLHALRRLVESAGQPRAAAALADDLLKTPDLWTPQELNELREIRNDQAERLQSGPLDELARTFQPDQISEGGPGRVRLYFDLARQHNGALEQGTWILNGAGWSPPFAAHNDDELLARAGPALDLEPLRTDKEALEITLQIQQPADQPQNLLLVSAAGFQIGFLGASEGHKARWLATSGTPAALVADLRKGGGREFASWKPGAAVTLRLALRRGQGSVELDLGGARDRFSVIPPRLEGAGSFALRSWECLRLVALTIEAARR